jgi:hypothetical protein
VVRERARLTPDEISDPQPGNARQHADRLGTQIEASLVEPRALIVDSSRASFGLNNVAPQQYRNTLDMGFRPRHAGDV